MIAEGGSTQFDESNQHDIPSSPSLSASSTTVRDDFTPVCAGGNGCTGMSITIGVMNISSRYETPRSGIFLSLADDR